ncbi:MAG: HAMP domain-containing histidine kinase [Actinomycetota bacterium]|nr:HAMP domain-containing histidine kinase [Actinomycetota bacterium]
MTAALVLAGASALVATVGHARNETRVTLVRQAQGLALSVGKEANATNRRDPAASLRTILRALRNPLRLQGEAVVALQPDGGLFDPANPARRAVLPKGLTQATIDPQALLGGDTVSGRYRLGVFAAVPYQASILINGRSQVADLVVVLTRSPPTGLAAGGPWFLVAALVIIAVSLLVANRLGHRFVRPLEAAQAVTGRIAAGDLAARVPEPATADPELASLAASINAMAESLGRARGSERDFLLSVSHELRTPLTSIRGFAEAIEDEAITDVRQAAAVIASESRRLERLVGDLLDLAKLSAREFSLDLADVDLLDAVEATAAGFGPEAERLGIALHIDVRTATVAPPQALVVRADPDRLAQVVANLTENALSFAHGHVHVGFAPGPRGAMVWVDDDGPGIAPADLPSVFERLFTGRPDGPRKVGSGLGLAIVAELVHAMGGTVRAESPLDEHGGSRLVVTLPAAGDTPDAATGAGATITTSPGRRVTPGAGG